MREPDFADTVQVALVVRDLRASMRTYVERYGIGPWEIYAYLPTATDMGVATEIFSAVPSGQEPDARYP